jgi:hypothetical protein
MYRIHCYYDYKNIDSIIASWVVKRKFNNIDLLPFTKGEEPPYVWTTYRVYNSIVFMGVDDFPFVNMKQINVASTKFYVFNNNPTYINKYNIIKSLFRVKLREILDTEKSVSKMAWEYVFPDVKIPIFIELFDDYIMNGNNKKFGDFFKNNITYIQDMREKYIRIKDFSDMSKIKQIFN